MLKLLYVLRVVWLVLGALAAIYVVFVYKKSAFIPALIFLAGFGAIAFSIRHLERKQKGSAQPEKTQPENAAQSDETQSDETQS